MSIRLPFLPVPTPSGSVLPSYWQPFGFCRPRLTLFLVNPQGVAHHFTAQIDTGSDYTILDPTAAIALGYPGPYPRQVQVATAGGAVTFGMPDDGTFALYITDYRSYYFYLPAPPLGIWTGTPTRSVLGLTGFLQYFDFEIHHSATRRPEFELSASPTFPGLHGSFQPSQSLFPHIRSLRLSH